ncbi:MAG TPA: acylphosphatase [Candidatus Limnocylindrales bacterium]|nr:acylphosphatase [Candidatus Limnocylindrales bacterium]
MAQPHDRAGSRSERLEALAFGRVQGVGFRWFVREEARRLGLDGWVRNRSDGAVELNAEGQPAVLDRFVARLREGPPGAMVDRLEVRRGPGSGALSGFEIRAGSHRGD